MRTETDNDIYNKMEQHMNTKIMGLHTKLTNLVFHKIDRLNMNEEPVNSCNPENQLQKAENSKVPNNTGREST